MLAGHRHAAIDRGLGDIDGARRQTDGAAYGAVADRKRVACRDDVAVDGGVVQVKALSGPVQVAFDAGRIGVAFGCEYVARGVRAGERCRGKRGERERDERE